MITKEDSIFYDNETLEKIADAGYDIDKLEMLSKMGIDIDSFLNSIGITPKRFVITVIDGQKEEDERKQQMAKQVMIDRERALQYSGEMLDAIILEDYPLIESLVKQGADPNFVYNKENDKLTQQLYTPITYAIRYCRYDAVDVLVRLGADINYLPTLQDSRDYLLTPLHAAMGNVNIGLLDRLLALGADINSLDSNGDTVLSKFINHMPLEAIDVLVERGINIDSQNKQGLTALHKTIDVIDNAVTARHLINCGCSLDIQDNHGRTPLHYAALEMENGKNRREVIKALINAGASLNDEAATGMTQIGHLAKIDDIEAFKLIMRLKREILPDSQGRRPFHIAAEHAQTENLIGFFLERPKLFDVNAKDNNGNTPMMLMSFNRTYAPIFEKALANGLDLTLTNNRGETILDVAKRKKAKFMLALLESYRLEAHIEGQPELEMEGIQF